MHSEKEALIFKGATSLFHSSPWLRIGITAIIVLSWSVAAVSLNSDCVISELLIAVCIENQVKLSLLFITAAAESIWFHEISVITHGVSNCLKLE